MPDEDANNNQIMSLIKELWGAAVNLRGSIEPSDYKRYVLPIIFLRFLSLRYEKRREELEIMVNEPKALSQDDLNIHYGVAHLTYYEEKNGVLRGDYYNSAKSRGRFGEIVVKFENIQLQNKF